MCAEGADGARRPLHSRPVVRSCVWVWGPGGQGAGAAQGRAGTPGGSPGPWVCMVLQLTRAGSSLGPICTQQETEAQRGGDTGGGPMACAASAPHRGPGHALSHAWVCQAARAGCAGQRKEHSSRVPCADRPRRRRQLPAPPRCPPRRAILAGVARCWRRWSVMWLWPGPSWSLGSSPGSSTGRWAAQCLGHGSMHQGACGVPPHP